MTASHSHSETSLVDRMNEAGKKFLNSLSSSQKEKACFEYLDGERIFWYYPPMNRHGLSPVSYTHLTLPTILLV